MKPISTHFVFLLKCGQSSLSKSWRQVLLGKVTWSPNNQRFSEQYETDRNFERYSPSCCSKCTEKVNFKYQRTVGKNSNFKSCLRWDLNLGLLGYNCTNVVNGRSQVRIQTRVTFFHVQKIANFFHCTLQSQNSKIFTIFFIHMKN